MDETGALSPEIVGLFMKIQSQAEEYSKAFDMLEKSRKEFDVSVAKLNELESHVRHDSELAISRINTNVLESLIILKNRTEDTVRLTIDLGDIKTFKQSLEALKDDLTQLQSKLNRQSDDIDSALRFFKKKSEMELESTLQNLKTKMDKEIHSEGQKIELRLNLRFKQVEGVFISFDERIKSLEDSASTAIKRLSLEIDLIKHGYNLDEYDNSISSSNLGGDDIQKRVSDIELMMSTVMSKVDDLIIPHVPSPTNVSDTRIEEVDKRVSSLNQKLAEFNKQQEESSKGGAGTALSIAAILIAIIAVVLSLI